MIHWDPKPADLQDGNNVRVFMVALNLAMPLCFPRNMGRGRDTAITLDITESDENEGPVFGIGAKWDAGSPQYPLGETDGVSISDETMTQSLSDVCQQIGNALYTQNYIFTKVDQGAEEQKVRDSLSGVTPRDYQPPPVETTIGALFSLDGSTVTRNEDAIAGLHQAATAAGL